MFLKAQPKIKFRPVFTKVPIFSFAEKLNRSVFSPIKFDDLDFVRSDIKAILADLKYKHLTNIQSLAYDSIQKSNLNCILADTGSGKTLAYALPVINDLYNEIQSKGDEARLTAEPRGAIILTSSKELSAQIFVDFKKIDRVNKLKISRLGPISQMSTYVKHMVRSLEG
jgi:superfamily II DNA/RNA helicase